MDVSKRKHIIRKMERETLPIFVLGLAMKENGVHGYKVMKELENYHNGTGLSPSVVYPMLLKLENGGYLSSRWDMGKMGRPVKLYEPTEKAKEIVKTYADIIDMNRRALEKVFPEEIKIAVIPLESAKARNRK